MESQQSVAELRARVAELEELNRELSKEARPKRRFNGRSMLAAILIIASVVIAPAAAVGAWARVQLVDTDRFVATFAPLAKDPAVQAYITDQAMEAIEANVDIDGLVSSLFDGLESMDLPPEAAATLPLLEAPTATGIRSLIDTSVSNVIASEQFAVLWESVLRETHSTAIAVIQNDPNAALQLDEAGTLSINLSIVIAEVKQVLIDQGMGFADQIPVIDRTIPLVTSDAFTTVRSVYQLAVTGGTALPWITLGLLVIGVAVARNRARALAWGGAGLAVSFLTLSAGIGIGRLYFVGTVSPAIMPANTAHALFGQLTEIMHSTIIALIVLSLFVAVGAWLAGASRPARAVRGLADSAFSSIRGSAEKHGITTGNFGAGVERWQPTLQIATVMIAVLLLFVNRPITMSGIIWTVVLVLLVLAAIELVRRPQPTVEIAIEVDEELDDAAIEDEAEEEAPRPAAKTRTTQRRGDEARDERAD